MRSSSTRPASLNRRMSPIFRCGSSGLLRHREAALAHQRVDAGVAAAERAVAVGRVDRVADREHVVAQPLGDGLVAGAAGLGEGLPGVRGQRVGPQVAVVAGGVAVAAEDVHELRRAVAHDDLGRHAERGQRLALERVGVDRAAAREVQLHVDQRARQVLDGLEALVELVGALDLLDQRLRDRLAGLVVQREAIEDLGRRQPVLEQLRRKLDVVASDARARDRRVVHVRAQAVQRVAELVEQRLGVVQLISTGSPGLPFTKFALFETIVVTSPSKRSCVR